MNLTKTTSTFTNLACAFCDKTHSKDILQKLCSECNRPLFARYDLNKARKTLTKENLKSRPQNMWRYEEVLPVQYKENIVTMNEGWTRTVFAERLGKFINCKKTYIKDESTNPTSSFKARGLSMAVSRATELGATRLAIPSAGNAAGAMSAYAALKGVPAHVFMPVDVPKSFIAECTAFGAQINLVNGLITDCGVKVREGAESNGWFDVSTLREPYRVEGKKTMGYEIVEQLNWEVPDVIIYPTGGGTGLIGVWKGLEEMEQLGLIGSKRPRMVSVQSTGCSPIVKAFQDGDQFATKWEGAKTIADGLRVPAALGDFLVLKALRESNGIALSVTDEEMVEACCVMGKFTGIFAAPEGGACLAAQMKLLKEGWIKEDETVVIFNTGTGLKYTHCFVKN